MIPDQRKNVFVKLKDDGWKLNIDFSLDASYGNTDEQSTRLGSKLENKKPLSSLQLDASYYYKLKSGKNTDNKLTTGVLRKWFEGRFPLVSL